MPNRSPRIDADLAGRLDDLVRDAGGDPDSLAGKLAREMIHTALKLLGDGADTGELKLISRSLKELRYALKVFRDYADVRKASIFGSARTPEDHADYLAAASFARRMAEAGWMVITGGGGGVMAAGHGGAGRAKSFGVSIRLPFETIANPHIAGDPKHVVFRYFFTRKLMFASQAHCVVLLPGGFGTLDEGFEVLTLVQTGKSPVVPIVMLDPPGGSSEGAYWKHWDHYIRRDLLANGLISPEDLNLYFVTDDADAAVRHVLRFYRNYHSQRFVRDDLVIRMQRPLGARQIDALNERFGHLVADGRIEACGPLEGETEHLELPRLRFTFVRRAYGDLRALIDRINEMDAENTG